MALGEDSRFMAGIMITNTTDGNRTDVLNPNYENIKLLRGNNSNMQYHFYYLYKIGKLPEFIWFFPQYLGLFQVFEAEYLLKIETVYQLYYYHYICRKYDIKMSTIERTHLYNIHHDVYLPAKMNSIRKFKITREIVRTYFDCLPHQKLFQLMTAPVVM